ncbi:MAG: CoA activase [Chloroflexi bacterium]|nr:CoA activase [Chloroflexota bacterium]
MITAGVDLGSKTVKVVLLNDGKILAKSLVLTGFDQKKSAEEAFEEALKKAGKTRADVANVVATGLGRKDVTFSKGEVTMVAADAKGVAALFPAARTIIDIGAEEGRGIKTDGKGRVLDFAVNEKCAAGAGTFVEAMSRALEITVEQMGQMSLQSTQETPLNATCAVFAESEVVSLIHQKFAKSDIAKAVHDGIATRITSMVRRVGVEKDVVLIGGVARNPGLVASLRSHLEVETLFIPEDMEYVGALGAAIAAAAS